MAIDINMPVPMSLEQFKEALRKNSFKATPQRLAVHSAMLELGHASADMVAEYIQGKIDTKVTVASVYNILTQMSDINIYKRRLSSNSKMYFDVNTVSHIHLYDTENHTFKDIVDPELVQLVESHLARKRFRGMQMEGIEVQILCHPRKKGKK